MAFINDGFPTFYSFENKPNIKFKEKSITPPPIQGGGENDTTTMRNTRWRTRQPKQLITLGPSSGVASYDPEVYDDILDMINVNQRITIFWPDGSNYTFWGWLDEFAPNEVTEGSQPDAAFTVIPSNQDNNDTEVDPVYNPPS